MNQELPPLSAATQRWPCPTIAVCLALLTLAAAALRLWQINESLWLDELHTSWTVAAPGEIYQRAQRGNQSPCFFLLAWCSSTCFGPAEWTLRLPALLAGLALVPATSLAVWRWSGSQLAAVFAAALIAADRQMVFYAQEARVYALVQFFGLLHVALFWRILERPTAPARLTFVLLGVFLFHLHYTAGLLFLAEACGYLAIRFIGVRRAATSNREARRPRYSGRQFALDLGCLLICCLAPTIFQLTDLLSRRSQWEQFIDATPDGNMIAPFYTYLLLPGLWAVGLAAYHRLPGAGRWPRGDRPTWATVWLIAAWALVPPTAAWLLTAADRGVPLFFYRYLIVSSVGLVALTSLALCLSDRLAPRIAFITMIIAASLYGGGMLRQFADDGHSRPFFQRRLLADRAEDWRGAIAFLNASKHDQQPLFLRSGLIESNQLPGSDDPLLREFCLLPLRGLYPLRLASPTALIPLPSQQAGNLSQADLQRLLRAGGGWFLLRGNAGTLRDVERQLLRRLAPRGGQVAWRRSFGPNLHLLQVVVNEVP